MGEVHLIGHVSEALDFEQSAIFVHFSIQTGSAWRLLQGQREGQTHVDVRGRVLSHPIDLHLATKGLQGWPKIVISVYSQDSFGRDELVAYGFAHIPFAPGKHELRIATWRPTNVSGGLRETLSGHFLGGTHQLRQPENVVGSSGDRHKLTTVSCGTVVVVVNVVSRNLNKFGIET